MTIQLEFLPLLKKSWHVQYTVYMRMTWPLLARPWRSRKSPVTYTMYLWLKAQEMHGFHCSSGNSELLPGALQTICQFLQESPLSQGSSRVSLICSFWQSGSSIPVSMTWCTASSLSSSLGPIVYCSLYLVRDCCFLQHNSALSPDVKELMVSHAVGRAQLTVSLSSSAQESHAESQVDSSPHSCYIYFQHSAETWQQSVEPGDTLFGLGQQCHPLEIFIYLVCYDAVIPAPAFHPHLKWLG